MDINNELEQKLISSNKHIDSVLNSSVNIKFICKINDRYLFNKETMSLPSINVIKRLLNNNYILDLIIKELNISVTSIKAIPLSYYNNYNERYYIINVDTSELININPKYIYSDLSNISDKSEYSILLENNI